jgi:hypothetical protein
MSPDNLLVRVHSRNSGRERVPSAFFPPSLQLTTASVFDSRRARPFVEDLRCRKVGQLGVLETEKPFRRRRQVHRRQIEASGTAKPGGI